VSYEQDQPGKPWTKESAEKRYISSEFQEMVAELRTAWLRAGDFFMSIMQGVGTAHQVAYEMQDKSMIAALKKALSDSKRTAEEFVKAANELLEAWDTLTPDNAQNEYERLKEKIKK
jgi:type IV secretory pathway VirJ component